MAAGELHWGRLTVSVAFAKPVFPVIRQASPSRPTSTMLPEGRARVTLQADVPRVTTPPGQCESKSLSLMLVMVLLNVAAEQVGGGGVVPLQRSAPAAEKPVTNCPAGQDLPASPLMPEGPCGPVAPVS